MLNMIGGIISFIGLLIFIFAVRFMNQEGKDERGSKIIGKAGMAGFVSFLFGYHVIFLINAISPLTGTQYTFASACLLAFVLASFSGTIWYLRRKY